MRRGKSVILFSLALALVAGAIGCGGSHGNVSLIAGPSVWTDPASGLSWQNGDLVGFDFYNWADAISYCDNLSWAGKTDWRLPTISELRSLIRGCAGTITGGACPVADSCLGWKDCWWDACDACQEWEGPGPYSDYLPAQISGNNTWYWSASAVTDKAGTAWGVNYLTGLVENGSVGYTYPVRCVR